MPGCDVWVAARVAVDRGCGNGLVGGSLMVGACAFCLERLGRLV